MTESMRSVTHVHRDDPRNVFSEMFRRGQVTPADGGHPADGNHAEGDNGEQGAKRKAEATAEATTEADTRQGIDDEMRTVDHEAPDEEGAARVWNRGDEADEE